MKEKAIKELQQDKDVVHRKFGYFVELAKEKGYTITCVKEYSDKFKFKFDGYHMIFDKMPELSWKWQLELCEMLYDYHRKNEGKSYGQSW